MKQKIAVIFILVFLVGFLSAGCAPKENPNHSTVKLEFGVKEGKKPVNPKVHGVIRANSPKTAGFAQKNLEVELPGSVEFKAGPSQYEIRLYDFSSGLLTFKMTMDGREMKRGSDVIIIDDPSKGYFASFEIKEKEAAK